MSNIVYCIREFSSHNCMRVKPSQYPILGSRVLLMIASSTLVVGVRSLGVLLDPSPKGSMKQWRTKSVGGTIPP